MKTYQREALLGIPVGLLLALALFSSSLAQTSVEVKYVKARSDFRGAFNRCCRRKRCA